METVICVGTNSCYVEEAFSAECLQRSISMGAWAYIPKEQMAVIPAFFEGVITLGRHSNVEKMFQRLGGLFNKRFGSRWVEDEKKFWGQVLSGDYCPRPVILKK